MIVTVAIVAEAENLPVVAEGKVSNLFVDTRGRLHTAPSTSPTCAFQIASGGVDFADIASGGVAWESVSFLKVSGAGVIEIRFAVPRDGHETETLTLEAGEALPGQIVELVVADPACYPIRVWR